MPGCFFDPCSTSWRFPLPVSPSLEASTSHLWSHLWTALLTASLYGNPCHPEDGRGLIRRVRREYFSPTDILLRGSLLLNTSSDTSGTNALQLYLILGFGAKLGGKTSCCRGKLNDWNTTKESLNQIWLLDWLIIILPEREEHYWEVLWPVDTSCLPYRILDSG